MDLVTCPSCQFTFSPTPGKAVKCPACMRLIAATADIASSQLAQPIEESQDSQSDAPPSKNLELVLGGAAFLVLAGLSAGILIARSMAPPSVPQIAQQVPKTPPPDVATPKITPPTDDPDPVPPKIDSKIVDPVPTPKVRPIDPAPPPPFKEDPPLKANDAVTAPKIDEAVRKGVAHLITTAPQWLRSDQLPLGHAALGGLALLECKTPASHPVVRQAAEAVRRLAPGSDKTCEASLAIVFLDRLGDARDRGLIQSLGARLVASQQASGGFTYGLGPALTSEENAQLLHFLRFTRPTGVALPQAITLEDRADEPPDKLPGDVFDPFAAGGKLFTEPIDPRADKVAVPDDSTLVSLPPRVVPRMRLSSDVGTVRLPAGGGAVTNPATLTPPLQRVPAVINQGREKDQMILSTSDGVASDHGSLQFALLGLWAARRHGVVSDRALLLAEARMRKLQRADGFWNYDNENSPKASMICSGVLALTLGHAVRPQGLSASLTKDASFTLAMDRLGAALGDPNPPIDRANDLAPTYFLWSLQRVAVMLDTPTIGGKDWYAWGAETLLRRQDPQGSWSLGALTGSTPHIDTSSALLFLVRSNLVHEVTDQVRLETR